MPQLVDTSRLAIWADFNVRSDMGRPPLRYAGATAFHIGVADDRASIERRDLFQVDMKFGQVEVGHVRKQVVCQVITVVMRMQEDRTESVIRYVPRIQKNATRFKPVVIGHFAKCCDGMENRRARGDP